MRLILCFTWFFICTTTNAIPVELLYDIEVPNAVQLPKGDDISSQEIKLKEPLVFFGVTYDSIFVNSNGFVSFLTELPLFINIEFPLDYAIIAPFYANVDTRKTGTITYYETENPELLQRATENVHEAFLNYADFQATSLFVVTWQGVGYYNQGSDKVNTFQIAIYTDGVETYVEFLYPQNGIQWIQGTGDVSGLPDARAQAGIISADRKVFTLPGSGTEQVRNLERWSNIGLEGQFLFRVDEPEVGEPDGNFSDKPALAPTSCAEAPTSCHVQATCIDYQEGFCCKCDPQYYGNGKYCVKKDTPLRASGKLNGKINGERVENLDLQSYIVIADGRAYTAISNIPESIGYDIQTVQVLGGIIGYLFAKPIRNAVNGFQITGGYFNNTVTISFLNTSQNLHIKEKFLGLNVYDMLRVDIDIEGDIPALPNEAKVNFDEYEEQYTLTAPGVIQMSSQRVFWYNSAKDEKVVHHFNLEQTLLFDYCKYENNTAREIWRLKVGKNFISYESKEQIIRFGMSNKIIPQGDFDPCEEGRTKCTANSACVVENDNFRCICNPGYQSVYNGNEAICADINECQTGQHECDYNAKCKNIIGSYTCHCNPGFEGDGHICVNAKSCDNVTCHENAECEENNNIAICRCLKGFTSNGQYCDPIIDQSCHIANNCSPFGYCSINPETNIYHCSCLPGYNGDGYTCVEIPTTTETPTTIITETTKEGQRPIQTCLLGVCWCPSGYKVESGSKYCTLSEEVTTPADIVTTEVITEVEFDDYNNPEVQCFNSSICFCPKGYNYEETYKRCIVVLKGVVQTKGASRIDYSCDVINNCDRHASCLYSDENHAYQCVCNEGYEGNGFSCAEEVISCTQFDNCSPQATCTYDEKLGRSKCICNPGYDGDGLTCNIIAICTNNQDCTPTEECIYTSAQRYECVCKEGHLRDSQHQCVAISGTCGGGRCVENAECLFDEVVQTFYCTCKTGYVGDGITECKVKPIGCDTLNNCGAHATCKYNEEALTYKCACQQGFFGDGFYCYAERNCHTDPNMCDAHAACVTDSNRRFICQCNSGYIGNGTICKEISRHEGNFLLVNQGMATLRIPLDKTQSKLKKPIQVKTSQTTVGLDIDCLEGRVYWSDINGRAIRSALFNGSSKDDFIKNGIGSPEGLAVDWVSRNIYWTDSTLDTIEVANLDSKRRRVLFNTDLVNPRGIAVHPQRGKIFWTDWDRQHPKIEWSNADGTGREIFFEGQDVSLPNSLTIDYDTEQLCYADAGTKKIECVHIDTKMKQTIAVNCTYPFGITTTDKHIYWSDWISKKIERVDKYNLNRLPPLNVPVGGTGNKLFGLVAVANTCPPLTNVCQYFRNQCPAEHICLPNGTGSRQCLCARRSDIPNDKPSCNL